jgi:Flp pilus assembly protein TadG
LELDEANMIIEKIAKRLRRSVARPIAKNEDGVTAIEFAMIAPVFFFLMGSLMETGIMLFAEYVMQTSVQEAARFVRTGQAQTAGTTSAAFKTKICDTATVISNCSARVTVSMISRASFAQLATAVPSYLNVGSDYGAGTGSNASHSCGNSEQAVALIATYDWDFTMPWLANHFGNVDGDTKRRLAGIYMFQNEPFPTGGACGA